MKVVEITPERQELATYFSTLFTKQVLTNSLKFSKFHCNHLKDVSREVASHLNCTISLYSVT
jgi:hypothetical protein